MRGKHRVGARKANREPGALGGGVSGGRQHLGGGGVDKRGANGDAGCGGKPVERLLRHRATSFDKVSGTGFQVSGRALPRSAEEISRNVARRGAEAPGS